MFKVAKLTDPGLKRSINEDSILVDETHGLFVVSDGMGGHERGEVASQMIVDCFYGSLIEMDDDETIPFWDEDDENTEEDRKKDLNSKLNNIINNSSEKMISYSTKNAIKTQMGATVVGMYKLEGTEEMSIFHLGDSRAYRIRDYKIERITTDHSEYEEKKSSGKYSEEELSQIGRNKITKAVGNFKAISLEINYTTLFKKDIYLLCSDGVSDLCSDEELLHMVLKEKDNFDDACNQIKKLVHDRGAKDNLSLIIFMY